MTPSEPRLLDGVDLDAANAVYSTIGFQPSRAQHDRTFGWFEEGELVALGRLQCQAGGELELGGFWVRDDRRGTGLARRLVVHVLATLAAGSVAWCIAFEHLADFYLSFGMEAFEPSAAPASIREKLAFCEEQRQRGLYHPVRLLRYRRPASNDAAGPG